jgi:hypothetical protein
MRLVLADEAHWTVWLRFDDLSTSIVLLCWHFLQYLAALIVKLLIWIHRHRLYLFKHIQRILIVCIGVLFS